MSDALGTLARELLAPAAPLDCWSWLEQHLATAPPSEAGRRFSLRHARLFRHWLDLVSSRLAGASPDHDPYAARAEEIWLVTGTQLGKDRSWMNAALAYMLDAWPRSIGYFMPRHRDLSKVLRGRIRPLIVRTPRLARHLPRTESARADALGNSLLQIGPALLYPLAGGVANDLRSTPLRALILNEFDIYPPSVQEEGDPIELALERLKSYSRDRLAIGGTTCTFVHSHGWRRLVGGSHERLLVACRTCGRHDWLNPAYITCPVENATPGDIQANDLALWFCPACKRAHTTDDKDAMVTLATEARGFTEAGGWAAGVWRVDQDHPDGLWKPAGEIDPEGRVRHVEHPRTAIRSGWMNTLYSPDIGLGRFLAHAINAKAGNDETHRTHTNTWAAEPWLPRVEPAPSTDAIVQAAGGIYPRFTAPEHAQRLAVICDQQGNQVDACWFPFVVRAFGAGGESWLVDAGEVHGWDELELLEQKAWVISGVSRVPDVLALDGANGTMRIPVQQWSAANPAKRLVLRGAQFMDTPWMERRPSQRREKRNKRIIGGARVFTFHSTGWKNELDQRIRRGGLDAEAFRTALRTPPAEDAPPPPPRIPPWHLPADAPEKYLASLTAEERVHKMVRLPGEGTRPALVWQPRAIYDQHHSLTYRADNHWWDCETMALVVCDIQRWNKLEPIDPEPPQPAPQPPQPGEGWVDSSGW